MATHFSILAWKIPWAEVPGRLQLMGSQESDTTEWLSHILGQCLSTSITYSDIEHLLMCFLVAQRVKNLPALLETQVQSLYWEDPLDNGIATHSSILDWRIPWTEEPGVLQSMGSRRVGHNWATNTFMCLLDLYICILYIYNILIYVCVCVCVTESCSVMSDSLLPHELKSP